MTKLPPHASHYNLFFHLFSALILSASSAFQTSRSYRLSACSDSKSFKHDHVPGFQSIDVGRTVVVLWSSRSFGKTETTLKLCDESVNDLDARELEDIKHDELVDPKRLIECQASIALPFPPGVAFDAFSDLTRQPSWCNYLESVEYVGYVDDTVDDDSILVPLRQSKWTVLVKGFSFSWTARDTKIIRPHQIEWESTSGMKNRGSVHFSKPHHDSSETQMTLRFTFFAPRIVSSLFRRSTLIRQFTENELLIKMLENFRDVVIEEDLK